MPCTSWKDHGPSYVKLRDDAFWLIFRHPTDSTDCYRRSWSVVVIGCHCNKIGREQDVQLDGSPASCLSDGCYPKWPTPNNHYLVVVVVMYVYNANARLRQKSSSAATHVTKSSSSRGGLVPASILKSWYNIFGKSTIGYRRRHASVTAQRLL
jgi:hypothetical protein